MNVCKICLGMRSRVSFLADLLARFVQVPYDCLLTPSFLRTVSSLAGEVTVRSSRLMVMQLQIVYMRLYTYYVNP